VRFILLGFFLRLLVAIWNSFFGPSLGAEGDALTFHLMAIGEYGDLEEAKFQYGWIYSVFLSYFYAFTTPSLFLGSLLSCFAWLISAIFFDKSLRLLSVKTKDRKIALLFYALVPTSILFTSVTLREVYQLLFLNIAIYSSLKIFLSNSNYHWLILFISCALMSSLHIGFLVFSFILILTTIYFNSGKRSKGFPLEKFLFSFPILIVMGIYGYSSFETLGAMGGANYAFSDGIIMVVENYQGHHNQARAMYSYQPQIDSLLDFLLFVPLSLGQYLFEPMPWRISTFFDLSLFLENFVRGLLIIIMLRHYFNLDSSIQKKALLLIVLMYFALETLFAFGTVNWGTAARHHVPGLGILLMGAFFPTESRINNIKG